jgi:hypothetical protein
MRAAGHAPCVLLETSPGRQQVWVRIGLHPVEPATATATARRLAATVSDSADAVGGPYLCTAPASRACVDARTDVVSVS